MKRLLMLGIAVALSLSLVTIGSALWLASSNPAGAGASHTAGLPDGNQPNAATTPPTGSAVVVSWIPSTGGAPVAGYEVRSYDATSGTERTVGTGCSGINTGTTCTETSVPAGSWRYTVTPRLASWSGAESPRSTTVLVDPTPPTVAITFPVAGAFYTDASWNAGCASRICGTAADTGTGVAIVQVSVRQATGNYWDGAAFASVTEVFLFATGTTSWSFAFPAANFTTDGAYTVRAVANDFVGGSGTASRTATIDRTAPTVAIAFPANGSTYNATSWNAGCSSSICGTAADAGSGVNAVQVSIRQGSGNYWNGTAFASATEVLLAATGTTTWSLPFPAANLPTDGAYTVRAIATDGMGLTASASLTATRDTTRPTATALTLFNANNTISPTVDEVRITYSEPLLLSTICAIWAGTGNQSLGGSGVVVTIPDVGLFGNESVTATASACTLHIGSTATGTDWTTLNATFSGTGANESRIVWNAATNMLTIHLGSLTSLAVLGLHLSGTTAVYTPDAAITDMAGNPIITTPFSASGQRF
jgi:hypothetical protein